MKDVRLYVIHKAICDVKSFLWYYELYPLKDEFNFIWDTENPDYVVATEHVYFFKNGRKDFERFLFSKDVLRIFCGTELYMPDFNIFDYCLGFSDEISCGDRYAQLMTPDAFYTEFVTGMENSVKNEDEANSLLIEKKGFCNFLYSNGSAHKNRDKIFRKLCEYKKVDSLGKWLNNTGGGGTGFVGHQRDCLKIKGPYKFSIAFENASCSGYSTEKILTSLHAHTVPIYWGDPNINKLINPKCFVNCHDFKNFDEVLERVKEIDTNDNEWCAMIREPWQTEKQKEYVRARNENYFDFWRNIFAQDKKDAFRVPLGYHPENYKKWFASAEPIFATSLPRRAIRKAISFAKRMGGNDL